MSGEGISLIFCVFVWNINLILDNHNMEILWDVDLPNTNFKYGTPNM